MRVSYNWLKEYVDVKVSPEKLAELLTMAGLAVESIQKFGADSVLEVEVTSNRPDWLSYIGVAREVSAITGAKLKTPATKHTKTANQKPQTEVSIKVDDNKLCARYTARVINDVRVSNAPSWLVSKLEAAGLRSVNNAVDITNFCLFETGEPLHAFDLDKIEGKEIIVRRAHNGEKIVTIDGVERKLDETMLVIADAKRPVAIAGVMGGLGTEVTGSTKNILLEAAYFDPVSIRRTSRKLGLSSESSYRFERRVDILGIPKYSDRATTLITGLAGGRTGQFIDVKNISREKKIINLRLTKLDAVAGAVIAPLRVKKILTSLGLKPKSSAGGKLSLEIPAFRHDLKAETDIIEEVLRIYGYDRIPVTLPPVVEQAARIPHDMAVREKIRLVLTALGADEIITYSLIGRKMVEAADVGENEIVEMLNPLTSEQEIMRPSLIPGMLGAIAWNLNRKTKDLNLFELGKVYLKKEDGAFSEKDRISLAITGRRDGGWLAGSRNCGLFDLKGIVETLLSQLGAPEASFESCNRAAFSKSMCASLKIKGETAGVIGKICKKPLEVFDIKDTVYVCELDLEVIFKYAKLEKAFRAIPKYPSVFRDLSIIVGKKTTHAELTRAIAEKAGAILKQIQLIDRYTGKQIPGDKVSLTYRLEYRSPEKTLEDGEVSGVHEAVVGEIAGKFGATLRG